jgi:hypothetical protein
MLCLLRAGKMQMQRRLALASAFAPHVESLASGSLTNARWLQYFRDQRSKLRLAGQFADVLREHPAALEATARRLLCGGRQTATQKLGFAALDPLSRSVLLGGGASGFLRRSAQARAADELLPSHRVEAEQRVDGAWSALVGLARGVGTSLASAAEPQLCPDVLALLDRLLTRHSRYFGHLVLCGSERLRFIIGSVQSGRRRLALGDAVSKMTWALVHYLGISQRDLVSVLPQLARPVERALGLHADGARSQPLFGTWRDVAAEDTKLQVEWAMRAPVVGPDGAPALDLGVISA